MRMTTMKAHYKYLTLFLLKLIVAFVHGDLPENSARLPVTCQSNMFTVQLGMTSVLGQSVRTQYQLGLNGEFGLDLDTYSLIDYFSTCLHHVAFYARSFTTGRVTERSYFIRDSDNLTSFLEYVVTHLDALVPYDFYVGYQMKAPLNNTLFWPQSGNVRIPLTCFDAPANPANLTLNAFYNASYLLQWSDPPVIYNSPPACYFIVRLRYHNSGAVQEMEVTNRYYYLSKEASRSRLTFSVYSVYDVRCLSTSIPDANNCVNRTLRSVIASVYDIDPGYDYLNGATTTTTSSFTLHSGLLLISILVYFVMFIN